VAVLYGLVQDFCWNCLGDDFGSYHFRLRLKNGFDEDQDFLRVKRICFSLKLSRLNELDIEDVVHEREEQVQLRGN
jgi:hypothetical protein